MLTEPTSPLEIEYTNPRVSLLPLTLYSIHRNNASFQQRVGLVNKYSLRGSENQTCHPEFLHQSRLEFRGLAAFPSFGILEAVGGEPS